MIWCVQSRSFKSNFLVLKNLKQIIDNLQFQARGYAGESDLRHR